MEIRSWYKYNAVMIEILGGHGCGDRYGSVLQDEHKYSGIVEDCCCEYETVDHINEDVLHPLLQDLVKTPFFRYFKVCAIY